MTIPLRVVEATGIEPVQRKVSEPAWLKEWRKINVFHGFKYEKQSYKWQI